jgi:hypothetical protein
MYDIRGKARRKEPLGRRRSRWVDLKVDLREVGWGGINFIDLASDRDQWGLF